MEFLIPFRHPLVLLALLVPIGLLLYTWTGKGRRVILPFDHTDHRRSDIPYMVSRLCSIDRKSKSLLGGLEQTLCFITHFTNYKGPSRIRTPSC